MRIIDNLWNKLNILVPDPKCKTRENDYDSIVWNDERIKPTFLEVNSVVYGDIEILKKKKLKEANDECEKALSVITSQYSNAERETWVIQELEASNFQHDVNNLVDPKRPTPNMDWIIEHKYGLPVDDAKRQALATRILQKAALFHQLSSVAVGKRHKMSDAVEAATTLAELEAITF